MRRAAPIPGIVGTLLAAAVALIGTFGFSTAAAHTPHDTAGSVAVSPRYAQDQTVLVTTEGRLMRTEDGGVTWHPVVNGLPTKDLRNVSFGGPDGAIAYVTSPEGVYVSTDGGDTWQRTLEGTDELLPWLISASPVDGANAVMVSIGSGVHTTRDRGVTWERRDDLAPASAVTHADGDREVAVLGTVRGEVRTSLDGGETFSEPVPVSEDRISAVAAATGPQGESIVYAGDGLGGLYRSDDGGRTFSDRSVGLPADGVSSVTVDPASVDPVSGEEAVWVSLHDSGVWASTDAGMTWEWRAVGLTSDQQAVAVEVSQFRSVQHASDEDGRRVLFLAGFDGMFRSDDDGVLWRSQETLSEMITGLSVSPDFARDHEVVVSTYVKGTYRSDDDGDSWQFIADDMRVDGLEPGNEFLPVRRLHDVVHSPDYAADRTLFSATWTRPLRSTDGGDSWSSQFVSDPPGDTELRGFKIAVSPGFAEDDTVFLGSRQGEIFRSTARGDGDSYELLATFDGEIRDIGISPAFTDDRTLFFGSDVGVHRSFDGGETWEQTGPTTSALLAVSPGYATDRTVFAASQEGLWVTRDGGDTWEEITGPLGRGERVEGIGVSPDYPRDGVVLASVRSLGLFRSEDGAMTFEEVGTGLEEENILLTDFITNPSSTPIHFSPNFTNDHTVFGFAENRVVRSTDRGDTWTILDLPNSAAFPLPPDFTRPEPSTPVIHRPIEDVPPGIDLSPPPDDGRPWWPWAALGLAVLGAAGLVVGFLRRPGRQS